MPVTKSAKKALTVAHRRHAENLIYKTNYKRAAKDLRKAAVVGTADGDMMAKAQSTLDRAAKANTIHRNKAARLKSRLAKHVATAVVAPAAAPKKAAAKKATTKKAAPKKKA